MLTQTHISCSSPVPRYNSTIMVLRPRVPGPTCMSGCTVATIYFWLYIIIFLGFWGYHSVSWDQKTTKQKVPRPYTVPLSWLSRTYSRYGRGIATHGKLYRSKCVKVVITHVGAGYNIRVEYSKFYSLSGDGGLKVPSC